MFVILGLVLVGFFYFGNRKKTDANFFEVRRANLVQEVSVVGRVKSSDRVNLSFNISGRIVAIQKDVGQAVGAGQTIIQLDTRDARKSVADAEIALEKSVVDLERLRRAGDDLVVREREEAELRKLYEEAFILLSSVYNDFPFRINNLEKTFKVQNNATEGNVDYYRGVARLYYSILFLPRNYETEYSFYKKMVNDRFDDYQRLGRSSAGVLIESSLDSTYQTIQEVAEFFREARDITQLYYQALTDFNITPNKISKGTTEIELDELSGLSSKLDEYLISVFSTREKIRNQKNRVVDVDLDLRNQELVVQQRRNDLKASQDKLADHYLTAPFAGVAANVIPKVGEYVVANQAVVSLISENQFEIEANVPEADIAKIKIGDSADFILDAYGSEERFKAVVSGIDPAETVIEGLSTYRVTFQFEDAGWEIKSGMTADLLVVAEARQDVLVIPQRAVFRRDGQQLVRVQESGGEVVEVLIKTGLRGSDGYIEVLEGLEEGEKVITSF